MDYGIANSSGLLWDVAETFKQLGDTANSEYYFAKIYYFYPDSRFSDLLKSKYPDYRFPVEYKGRFIPFKD